MTASGSSAARILIVDDDVDMGEILAEILTARGYEVRVARDGEEGILRMREELPDLLVLDVEMPRLDGPGVAYRMLIENAGMQLVPVVLVSGVVGLAGVAARVGTPYCIAKPAAIAPLMVLIERALAERIPPTREQPG